MEPIALSKLATAIGCVYEENEQWVTGITSDSRQISPSSLFVALVGDQFDGHDYVTTALEQGAVFAVASQRRKEYPANVFYVEDTRLALLQLAGCYRKKQSAKVVAITGSVGKTTTKDMVACVLESRFTTLKTKENLNNEIGLSQMLLQLNHDFGAAALELGVDGPDQMCPMSVAASPDVAIVTNIGQSHLAAFGSQENIMKEKLDIAFGLAQDGVLLLNGDDIFLQRYVPQSKKTIFFGIDHPDCQVRATSIQSDGLGQIFTIQYQGKGYPVQLPALGLHNVYNGLAGFTAGVVLGILPERAAQALSSYRPTGMRQKVVSFRGLTLVEDCYNASPQSVTSAIMTLHEMICSGKKIVILSDMLELGETEAQQHEAIGRLIAKQNIDVLLSTGKLSRETHRGATEQGMSQAVHFETQDELTEYLKKIASLGDILWFKASRGMRLEHIINRFREEYN